MDRIKCLSLFSNVGMAETYFKDIGIDVLVANELIKERADFYSHLYPETEMICGDITDDKTRDLIVASSKNKNINFILATPPCQGMSRHGKRDPYDIRNQLIFYAVDVIKRVRPSFVMLENVPKLLTTQITFNDKHILILDYIKNELSSIYDFSQDILFNSADYGVPQSRTRCIIRMVKKNIGIKWDNPIIEKHVTLKEAIGSLPSLDPLVREIDKRCFFPDYDEKKKKGLEVSKWHYPPTHSWRHIEWMMHTPSGKTAVYNETYYPQKEDGQAINARLSCYRRYSWDKPANTVTQNNGVISSAACVHPGRPIVKSEIDKERVYSDPRVLTIYELLIISSLPVNWNIPSWASEKLIRNVIGEGIPPLMVKKIVEKLTQKLNIK